MLSPTQSRPQLQNVPPRNKSLSDISARSSTPRHVFGTPPTPQSISPAGRPTHGGRTPSSSGSSGRPVAPVMIVNRNKLPPPFPSPLDSPTPPFAQYARSSRSNVTPRGSPRSEVGVLHHSASSGSLSTSRHAPQESDQVSMTSVTPSIGSGNGGYAASGGQSSPRNARFGWRAANRASTIIVSSPLTTTSNGPPVVVNGRAPHQHTPSSPQRSTSDTLPFSQPKLQRKKSSASLLVSGIGRGLGRVGSVMRRNGNAPPERPQRGHGPKRGSSTLGDLDEEDTSRPRPPASSRSAAGPRPATTHGSLSGFESASGSTSTRSRSPMPPGWIRVQQQPVRPVQTESGVSHPFNVQHEVHVTAELDGMPNEWMDKLKAQGVSEADLLLITAAQRRQRQVKTFDLQAVKNSSGSPVQVSPPAPRTVITPPPRTAPLPGRPKTPISPTPVTAAPIHQQWTSTRSRPTPASPKARPRAAPNSPPSSQTRPRPTGRTTSPTSPASPSSQPMRRAHTSPEFGPNMGGSISGGANMGGASMVRSNSLIGKLLSDLDSQSARPSRSPSATLAPPETVAEVIDTPRSSVADHTSPVPSPPPKQAARPPSPAESHDSRRESVSSDMSLRELSRRLSDDLRGFRDLEVAPGAEDGWAASILAAWDGDVASSPPRTSIGAQRQAAPVAVAANVSKPSSVKAPIAVALTPEIKPTSLHSSARASPLLGPEEEPMYRRRSKSFDFDPAIRSTLYSPPPPPPHPMRASRTAESLHSIQLLERPPTEARRRRSIDSFGVAHSRTDSFDSTSLTAPSGRARTISRLSHGTGTQDYDPDADDDHHDIEHERDTSPTPSSAELDVCTPDPPDHRPPKRDTMGVPRSGRHHHPIYPAVPDMPKHRLGRDTMGVRPAHPVVAPDASPLDPTSNRSLTSIATSVDSAACLDESPVDPMRPISLPDSIARSTPAVPAAPTDESSSSVSASVGALSLPMSADKHDSINSVSSMGSGVSVSSDYLDNFTLLPVPSGPTLPRSSSAITLSLADMGRPRTVTPGLGTGRRSDSDRSGGYSDNDSVRDDDATDPSQAVVPLTLSSVGRDDQFPSSASSATHSHAHSYSNPTSPGVTEEDAFDLSAYTGGTHAHARVSALGLCLSLGETAPSPSMPSITPGNQHVSLIGASALLHTAIPPQSRPRNQPHPFSYSPPSGRIEHDEDTDQLGSLDFQDPSRLSHHDANPDPRASRTSLAASMTASPSRSLSPAPDRASCALSRMSSTASSIHSYNLHEVTVHRAYTRILRRVPPTMPERSETGLTNESGTSESHNTSDDVRDGELGGAMGALEEAAWRVALTERGA